jgi:hypothetical protein
MNQLRAKALVVSIVVLSSAGCTKKSVLGSGLGVSIPQVTGKVAGANGLSLHAGSAALMLKDPTACSSCSANEAQMAFGMATNFISIGQGADGYSCISRALVNGGDLTGDGTVTIMTSPDNSFKVKIAATLTGTTITSYSMHICEDVGATQNSQFVSGTVGADGTTVVSMKMDGTRRPVSEDMKAALTVSGSFKNGSWLNKNIEMQMSTTGYVGHYGIIQGADNLILKGSAYQGATPVQTYAKFSLLGDSPSNYAMDSGSAKLSFNSAPDTVASWDSAGNNGGSVYLSDVTSGVYFPAPTYSGTFATSESWDCSNGSAPVVQMQSVSAIAQAAIQLCSQQ